MAELIAVDKETGEGYVRIAVCNSFAEVGKIIENDKDKGVLYKAYAIGEDEENESI